MSLKTDQIIKILQLRGLGRKTAFKICDIARDEIIDNDNDLQEFLLGCIASNKIQRLPFYPSFEIKEAFNKGQEIIEKSEEADIKLLSYYDLLFPAMLKGIKDAPIVLNLRGNYKQLDNLIGIAIIGTREPNKEGITSGELIGEIVGKGGFNVVSGLAIGCDAAAHRGCLKGNGFTTAIVAHGLHTIYPKENKGLAEEIISKGGLLLSEYFIGTGALANYFVERDRLQAGLSKATIVIQTGIKGGTMHAVNATLEDRKILAAVKYKNDVVSEKVRGNEMLISQKKAIALGSDNLNEFLRFVREGNATQPEKGDIEKKPEKLEDLTSNITEELPPNKTIESKKPEKVGKGGQKSKQKNKDKGKQFEMEF